MKTEADHFFFFGHVYYLWDLQIYNSINFTLKFDFTVLFTHLKI